MTKLIAESYKDFVNEKKHPSDHVEELIDAKTAAKELKNLSGEKLGFKEFYEYVVDYYDNPGDYGIDTNSGYYTAIVSAYEDIPKWQDAKSSAFYKEYKKA